jgi:virulence factor Mce-like protein
VITKDRPRVATPPPSRPITPRRRPVRWKPLVVGPIVLMLLAAAVFVGLKAAYGGFSPHYDVSLTLPRTGEQLTEGSDVRMRGVIIGKVSRVELVDRAARLILQIDGQYRIPSDAQADISLTTLLGAKFVDLRFASYHGPWLRNGQRISTGHVGPELEDALDDGLSVLQAIKPSDLGTIVGELTTAARGHGADVARGLRANGALSTIFARTLDPQLKSLHDFEVVFGALRNSGVDLNELAHAINQGVPVYASSSAQKNLDKALRAIVPFADNLGDLLILNKSDWDRLMDSGDAVLQTIADRPGGLHDLVQGLYRYVYKLSGDPCTSVCGLTDGSGAAGFSDFIGGNTQAETIRQVCGALPPEVRALIPACSGGVSK